MTAVNQTTLTRVAMLRLLESLSDDPVEFSLYIKYGDVTGEVERLLGQVLDRGQAFDVILKGALKSPTGQVVFYCRGVSSVIWPPFPLAETRLTVGFDGSALRHMMEKQWMLAVVLVRLGHYAIGLFEGERLIDGKAGTGLIHARHHKGGSSANRFTRRREKQMEYFFSRVEEHSREMFEPHLERIDYAFYGGTHDTLTRMWKQCPFYQKLESKKVERLLTLREPRRSNLNLAVAEAYSSRFLEVRG
jgi:peptide subunit release factor 1 (eRF1)